MGFHRRGAHLFAPHKTPNEALHQVTFYSKVSTLAIHRSTPEMCPEYVQARVPS